MPNAPRQFRLGPSKQQAAKQYDQRRGSAASRGYGSKTWQWLRKEVFLRDLYTCQACGCGVGISKGDAHCDHKVAKDKGGTDDIENLQTLCASCHGEKTRRGD